MATAKSQTARRPKEQQEQPKAREQEREREQEQAREREQEREQEQEQVPAGAPVSTPRGLELPLPGMHISMPPGLPARALWWGGLAALAAFDVVDWPVAALVGAGSLVAERYAKQAAERQAAITRAVLAQRAS